MNLLSLLFRFVLAIVIAALGYWWFSAIMPRPFAAVVGLVAGAAEFIGPLVTRGGGRGSGSGLRMLFGFGLPIIAWPGIAMLVGLWIPDRATHVALAAIAATVLGVFTARHGQGRDQHYLISVLVAVSIPVAAMASAIANESMWGTAAACVAIGVAPLVAKNAHVWADKHDQYLGMAAIVAFVSAALVAARQFI
jgi:hypothetical protein